MSTRVFLIRHGATVLTAEDRFAGATDVELSDEGREQARRLAERLRDAGLRVWFDEWVIKPGDVNASRFGDSRFITYAYN